MSWYGKRMPKVAKAPTEEKLLTLLNKISLNIGQKIEIISIYPRGGNVVAWYFIDMQDANKVKLVEEQNGTKPVKKKAKKKVTKKAGS
jgi:hypothetical protein